MSDSSDTQQRRRWIAFGELIALGALIVSGLGVWIAWKGNSNRQPTTIVEQRRPIALTLRGKAENEGRSLVISPVEQSHALQSLTITLPGTATPLNVGSDGELSANDLDDAFGKDADRGKGTRRVRARISADYVETGVLRHASGNYTLAYRWEGGGLFGGQSLRLVSLSRS